MSYLKNTLELKKELLDLNLPRNTRLFTADAVSMYTNIPTHTALNLIGNYLNQYQRKHNNEYPKDAVRAGLRQTSMETAPGTHEKSKNKRKMQHQTHDYRIQTHNEPR